MRKKSMGGGANQRSSHTRSHLLRGHGPGVPLALEPRLPQVGGGIVIIESKAKGALLPLILFFDEKGDMDMIFGGAGKRRCSGSVLILLATASCPSSSANGV